MFCFVSAVRFVDWLYTRGIRYFVRIRKFLSHLQSEIVE